MFRGRSGLAGLAARSNNPEDRRREIQITIRGAWNSQTPPSPLISMEHIASHSVIHGHFQVTVVVVVVAVRHGRPMRKRLPPSPGPLPPIPTRTTAHRILRATVVETAGLRLPVFPGCVSVRRGAAGEGLPPSERETDICYQPPSVLGFPQAIDHLGSRRQFSDPASSAATWLTVQPFIHPKAAHASESQARRFVVGTLHKGVRTCHI